MIRNITKKKILNVLNILVKKTEKKQLHWELYIKGKAKLEEKIIYQSRIGYDFLAELTYWDSQYVNKLSEDEKWTLCIYRRKEKGSWTFSVDDFPRWDRIVEYLCVNKTRSEEIKEQLDRLIKLVMVQTETEALKNEDIIKLLYKWGERY